jgi:tryptophanyl-tRNA synthetase
MGLLERCHAYKDKLAQGLTPNHGLFAYPVLMAADIILYQADLVPVGRDQKQHVEVARDIAGGFNHTYGETFVLPEPLIDDQLATIPGLDGRKMSKSYNNAIDIFIPREELKNRVMAVVTDTRAVNEIKDPDHCNLFALYRLFASGEKTAEMRDRYLRPGLKYAEVKKELIELIWNHFAPHRERRAELLKNRGFIHDLLKAGAAKARSVAEATMADARRKVGLEY